MNLYTATYKRMLSEDGVNWSNTSYSNQTIVTLANNEIEAKDKIDRVLDKVNKINGNYLKNVRTSNVIKADALLCEQGYDSFYISGVNLDE